MRRTIEQVAASLGDSSALLVDARAPERFDGRVEPIDRIGGHIPGARNYHYKRSVADDGIFLPADVLRVQLSEVLGTTPPEQTTMYCGSGVTACHTLLAMEHAGLPGATLFVGSWSEWSSDPSRPVERRHSDSAERSRP
jgi:thiosulfate/3-mercaptopyruvate sulfurtransferase